MTNQSFNHFSNSNSMFSQLRVTAHAIKSKFTVALENQEQVPRFYEMQNLTHRQINLLEEVFSTNAARIDAKITAPIVAGIIAPSAAPTSQHSVPIVGGWRTRRYVFEIEVEISDGVNHPTIEVISGYTDMDESAVSLHLNSFDPNGALYINDIVSRVRNTYQGPMGPTSIDRVCNGSSLIVPTMDPRMSFQQPKLYTVRPEDMFSHVANKEHFGLDAQDNLANQATAMMPITSNAVNNSASHYFSRLLNGIQEVQDQQNDMDPIGSQLSGVGEHHQDSVFRVGATSVKDTSYTTYTISDLLSQTGFRHYGFVTWRELCGLIPNLDSVTVITRSDNNDISGLNTPGWNGSNPETQVAFSMCQTLKAICMMMQISEVAFSITNQTEQGIPAFTYTLLNHSHGHNPYMVLINGTPVSAAILDRFKAQVMSVLWPEISRNNTRTLFATVRFSLTVNTMVEVSWDGGYPTPYVFPNFHSSQLSPLVTTDVYHADRLSSTVIDLLSTTSSRAQEGGSRGTLGAAITNFNLA